MKINHSYIGNYTKSRTKKLKCTNKNNKKFNRIPINNNLITQKAKVLIISIVAIIFICTFSLIAKSSENNEFNYNTKVETGIPIFVDFKNQHYISNPSTNLYLNLGIGTKITDKFQLELNLYHNSFKLEKVYNRLYYSQNFDINAIFINGEYDIWNINRITHFINFAAGISYNKIYPYKVTGRNNIYSEGKNKVNMVYNVGTGIKVNIKPSVDLYLQYKYYNLGRINNNPRIFLDGKQTNINVNKNNLKHHTIATGIILYF